MPLTKALLELGASVLAKWWKRAAINFLIGRFHAQHCLRAAVALLGQVVNDLKETRVVSQKTRETCEKHCKKQTVLAPSGLVAMKSAITA